MTIPQIFALVGVPSMATVIGFLIKLAIDVKIMMEAIQAQMRKDLMSDYNKYMKQGYIEDEDMLEWENRYQKYHRLGKNGIMDAKRENLLDLPNHT